MASKADVVPDQLFKVYTLLQDLLKFHVEIDTSLKTMVEDADSEDFDTIENTSNAIIETCNKIETCFSPKSCASCCCQA